MCRYVRVVGLRVMTRSRLLAAIGLARRGRTPLCPGDQRTHSGACLSYPKPEGPCVEFNMFLATRNAMHFTNFMECSQGRVGHDESL